MRGLYVTLRLGFGVRLCMGSFRKKAPSVIRVGGRGLVPEGSQVIAMLLSSCCQSAWAMRGREALEPPVDRSSARAPREPGALNARARN